MSYQIRQIEVRELGHLEPQWVIALLGNPQVNMICLKQGEMSNEKQGAMPLSHGRVMSTIHEAEKDNATV